MSRLSRRGLLQMMACSAAAHPLLSNVTFAAAPGDNRLVVIILRGGMDGLDVVRPLGDPDYAGLRSRRLTGPLDASLPLDGYFGLHPALAPLIPLWDRGELAFAHAVSTPYRDKRSHFDGQDLLEAGTGMDVPKAARKTGWLNRLLDGMPDVESRTAFAIGAQHMKVLDGPAAFSTWSPDVSLDLTPQARLLLERVYARDPLFAASATQAMALADLAGADENTTRGQMVNEAMGDRGGTSAVALAAFAAERLFNDTRIAAFSLNGWDMHRTQARAMPRMLGDLAEVIETLRTGLGPAWERTAVLAMTEFGRTARENGGAGTDHGTGGAMLMAGGAIRGGRVLGDWPGLTEAALYDRRDLMPTADVRSYAAWALAGLFGTDRAMLEGAVFPGLDLPADPGLLL